MARRKSVKKDAMGFASKRKNLVEKPLGMPKGSHVANRGGMKGKRRARYP